MDCAEAFQASTPGNPAPFLRACTDANWRLNSSHVLPQSAFANGMWGVPSVHFLIFPSNGR